MRSYGADQVFDYNSPTCASTRNNLKYAVDCIASDATLKICYSAIGRAGGQYIALNPFPEHLAATRKVIKPDSIRTPRSGSWRSRRMGLCRG